MKAKELTEQALPLLAKDAKLIGFVDDLIGGKKPRNKISSCPPL